MIGTRPVWPRGWAATPDESISFLPILEDSYVRTRDFLFVENFRPNHGQPDPRLKWQRAARISSQGTRFKLLEKDGLATEEFYNLDADPHEASPLDLSSLSREQRTAYAALKVILGKEGHGP